MNALKKTDLMTDFPHLQTDWQPLFIKNNLCYQHTHSMDLSQVRNIKSINIRQLDLYASRQAYCFPYCPRIYKYVIHQNDFNRRQLTFNLQVLIEKVPRRLTANFALIATDNELNVLFNKVNDIVKGFEYLFMRFGAFRIIPQMIGWTNIDVIKVWFNQDFASNKIVSPILDSSLMIQDLITILQESKIISNRHLPKGIRSFEQLFQEISYYLQKQESHRRHKQYQTTQPLGILSNLPLEPSLTKKNITFSYSTKDIGGNPLFLSHHGKTNSVKATNDDETLGTTSNHDSKEQSSLKIIQTSVPRRTQKRVSAFKPFPQNDNVIPLQQVTNIIKEQLQTLAFSDRYSTTVRKPINSLQTSAQEQWQKGKNQLLHYSTSSNPYSKFINMKPNYDKTSSTAANQSNTIRSSYGVQLSLKQSNQVIEQGDVKVEMWQKSKDITVSQEIKADLQALFHNEQEISFSELQGQLANVLL